MSKLIRQAYEYFDANFKGGNLPGFIKGQLPYTKYTTFLYGYMPLPYYALGPIDVDNIFINNAIQQKPIIVYIHIPFCSYKCSFCYYLSTAKHNKQLENEYIEAVINEVELVSQRIDLKVLPIRSVHIGGGTPTCLDIPQLEYLFKSLKRKFNINESVAIHCESNPDTIIDEEKLKCLLHHGVRHLDIGVQTFQDPILKLVGRKHTKKMARQAVLNAKKAGIKEINIDMMINLPDQTLKSWEDDLNNIVSLRPASVSIFCNALKTPHMLDLYYGKRCRFAPARDIAIMKIMAYLSLRKEGYQLEMTNFYSLNTNSDKQKAAPIPNVLSFGPRTWSLFNDIEYYNTFDLKEYMRRINKKKLPVCVGTKINAQRKSKQIIASGLQHVLRGVSKQAWEEYKAQSKSHFHALEKIERQKLITCDNGRIKLSLRGIFFSNDVFKEFYRYHEREYLFLRVVLNNALLRGLYFYIRGKEWSYKIFIFLNKLLPKIKM